VAENSESLGSIGSYDLLEKIGAGGMGVIYRARHWESKQIVAIKVMHAEVARNPIVLKRFEREFRICNQLDHPHIVRVLEFCGSGPKPYLVMEFIDGESIGDRVERDGKIPEEEALRLICQIADGLGCAHAQGLIHRDVKPDNIMVTRDGQAKLLDLGLAKDLEGGAELTRAGQGLGTPDFMAPEQFRNAKNASVHCDVYSLAATLYMMVTGRYPFNENAPLKAMMRKLQNELPAPRDLVPALSTRTDWAIRRAMSADPAKRPASCAEFVDDLRGQSRSGPEDAQSENSLWYVTYTDTAGNEQTIKGSTAAMRQAVQDGRLGEPAAVRASRLREGPFASLATFPEFRDLLIGPGPGPPLSPDSIARLTVKPVGPAQGVPISDAPTATQALGAEGLPSQARRHSRWGEWVKMLALVAVTVAVTVIAAKMLFSGGR
jgi:serine/threonine protein kinase